MAATRKALEQLRSAARGPDDPITRFYSENKEVIDETIDQLSTGLPVELTRMFLKMATGRFKLRGLIELMTGAAESELTASKVTDVSPEQGYGTNYETPTAAGQRMEQLRDSYMLDRILAAKAAGDRLAGLGDAHRQNLEGVLKRRAPDILVKQSTKFYAEQYKLYPDRD